MAPEADCFDRLVGVPPEGGAVFDGIPQLRALDDYWTGSRSYRSS